MSAMANTTPIVTTVMKPATNPGREKTPRDDDATPRVNIQDFCEEYYEDILPIIMDKIFRDKRKEVHTRLDFGEGSKEKRIREGSHYSSARTLSTRPDRTSSRDRSRGRSRLHMRDSSNGDRPQNKDRSCGVRESYDNSHSSYETGANHGYSYRDRDRSRHVKRGRDSESPLSRASESGSSDGGHWKSKSKRHKPTNGDDLTMPWMCEEVYPFTPRIRDPEDHVKIFQAAAQVEHWAMPTWCHMFNSNLIGATRVWFDELHPESIDSYKDLKAAFLPYFMQQKKYVKDPVEIHNIKQKDRETIEDFMEQLKVETGRIKGAPECMRIYEFMHGVNNPELTKRHNEHVPKTMEEMMITTTAFIRGEAVAAGKKKGHTSWRTQDQPKRHTSEKRSDFQWDRRTACYRSGIGGHMIHRMYVDGGSSTEVLYEHCFNRLRPEVKNQMVPTTISLTGFSGETIWPLGQLRLLVTIGDADHPTRAWMNFMIEVAIRGTLSAKRRTELCSLLKENLNIFAWKPLDMTGVPRLVAEHRLNNQEGYSPVRQKKRGQASKRAKAIQAELAESDEEKTAFHTGQGVYCYTKMSFGLKNAGATYQRLVDKAFDSQIGRNIEVYVDDLVIKSHTEAEMLRDIGETLWIKPCPGKTEAVQQLPSPRTIKGVQSLNGKLASLNRFLSKSAKKSLSLFKTLKKCIKKSDFHWTSKVEQAFKQLKQHLSKLPLLVAPKLKEELIVYLSASYGAISVVLMTERGTVQTTVYFISRALQGPKLNYTPIEKLVLSLVFATKRLRRTITKIERHVGRTQYHIPANDVGERAGPSGFLAEMPDESPPGASVVETQQEPCTLFTDGSSCVDGSDTAEYEAPIAGLRIAAQMGVRNVHVSVNSKLVANQVLGAYVAKEKNMIKYLENVKSLVLVEILKEKSIQEKEVTTVVEKDEPTWMTPIIEYLKEGTLLGDWKEASKLQGPGKVKFLIVAMDYFYEMDRSKSRGDNQRQSVKHPQSNGLVERANQSLGEGIKARPGVGNKKWIKELPHVLWAHRTMTKSSHGDTPFSLTYGTKAVIPAQTGMPTYRTAAVDAVHNDEELWLNLDLLEERREHAAIREAKTKLKMIKYYNARVRGVTFRPGDFVYHSNDASHAVDGGKLGPKWEGPYKVTEALGDGAYKLRFTDGTVLPMMWNFANLKKCYL
uniref:Uncharacterized protein n=1 Tax=Tanacetum cinerariifolium TaxID=118510 RepID=A0A6L2N245_TANCI|nr:hypothetical protein [Tanacetum cinerariifolium]